MAYQIQKIQNKQTSANFTICLQNSPPTHLIVAHAA